MKTLEKIETALVKGTNKSWFINNDMVTVVGGHSNEGTDYGVGLEGKKIVVKTTGMSHEFTSIRALVSQMRAWIAVDEEA